MRGKLVTSVAVLIAGSLVPTIANAQVIYSAGGFDSTTRFSTTYTNSLDASVVGNLRGQDSGVDAWKEAGTANGNSASTAVIENTDSNSPAQAVDVTYRGTDNRWAPPINIAPTAAKPDVIVSWSEKYLTPSVTTSYGPFFGIEGYDSTTSVNSQADLLGALGIDVSNGQINYFDSVGIETGPSITPGVFHTFSLDFNYQSQTFTARVDGGLIVANDSFVNPSYEATNFTDADLDALNVGGDPSVQASAEFDNYVVSAAPEPTSIFLFGTAAGVFMLKRSSRRLALRNDASQG